MTCGAAVVVTDAPGGMKDIVEYGTSGLLVAAGNPDALAAGLLQVLTQPALKRHCREQARTRSQAFHYRNTSQQYLDFCQSVLSATQHGR